MLNLVDLADSDSVAGGGMAGINPLRLQAVNRFLRDPLAVNKYVDWLQHENHCFFSQIKLCFSFFDNLNFEALVLRQWVLPILWVVNPRIIRGRSANCALTTQEVIDFWQELKTAEPDFVEYFDNFINSLEEQLEPPEQADMIARLLLMLIYACREPS